MRFFVLCSLTFLFIRASWAGQVSLIDNTILSNKEVIMEENEDINDQNEVSNTTDEAANDSKFKQMNDFIDQEDEKLKTIKLLNLDLERADLELKKKEIEQKISQLDKSEKSSVINTQSSSEDEKNAKPDIKLVSIFINPTKKQSILSINGLNYEAQEGQSVGGIVIKKIDSTSATVQYEDGEIQNIRIL